MLAPNTLLQNRYRIKRQLAQGGMGAIYEAEAVHLGGIIVAVKETFYAEDYLRQQFQREASVLAKLRHPVLPNGEGELHGFAFYQVLRQILHGDHRPPAEGECQCRHRHDASQRESH